MACRLFLDPASWAPWCRPAGRGLWGDRRKCLHRGDGEVWSKGNAVQTPAGLSGKRGGIWAAPPGPALAPSTAGTAPQHDQEQSHSRYQQHWVSERQGKSMADSMWWYWPQSHATHLWGHADPKWPTMQGTYR